MSEPGTDPESNERPRRGANPRLKTTGTLVAIPGVAIGGAARLENLSTTGACVEIEGQVEKGQSVELKLAHPNLSVVPEVAGEVMWSAETAPEKTRFGVRFFEPAEADQAVRPFLTAEAGSCLFREQQLVGFVVPHGKAEKAWSLFEASGKRLAVAAREETGYEVHAKTEQAGALPSFHASSLFEATCKSIGVEEPLRLDPPLSYWRTVVGEPPKQEMPALKDAPGCPIQGPKGPLGFLLETELPKSWLLVDEAGKQVAYLAGSGQHEYQICSMADAIDDELEFRSFAFLEQAVAAAFQLSDSSADIQIGELTTVGQVTPVRQRDLASVNLDHEATQITLSNLPAPKPAPRPASPKKTVRVAAEPQNATRKVLTLALAIVSVALLGYLVVSMWQLVQTFRS